jgi:hypothetical protein
VSIYAPYSTHAAAVDEENQDEKPKSIFERENVFRKPFEEKD